MKRIRERAKNRLKKAKLPWRPRKDKIRSTDDPADLEDQTGVADPSIESPTPPSAEPVPVDSEDQSRVADPSNVSRGAELILGDSGGPSSGTAARLSDIPQQLATAPETAPETTPETTPAGASLWDRAYKIVQDDADFSSYLKDFNRYLQKRAEKSRGDKVDDGAGERSEGENTAGQTLYQVQQWAEKKLGALKQTRLTIKIGDKEVVVRETFRRLLELIDKHKAVITAAMAADPKAKLAWGASLTILSMLINIVQQDKDAADGFEQICHLLVTGQLVEDTLSTSRSGSLTSTTRKAVVDAIKDNLVLLYAQAYRFQIRILLKFGRKKFWCVVRDALVLDDWNDMLKDAQKAAANAEREANQLSNADISGIYAMASDLTSGLERHMDNTDMEALNKLPIAGGALFDSKVVVGAGQCDGGTQVDALNAIRAWAEDTDGKLIYWLGGLAGTGKSTIALTMANAFNEGRFADGSKLAENTGLGASFFFSRGRQHRDSSDRFFSTIAWCLAQRIPQLRGCIAQVVRDNANIIEATNEKQLRELIINPIARLGEESFLPLQLFVVVDALDECHESDAKEILRLLLSDPLRELKWVRLRMLITSRSTTSIVGAWKKMDPAQDLHHEIHLDKIKLVEVTGSFTLDDPITAYAADDDITRFMTHKLLNISKAHDFPRGWATEANFLRLREMTGGLFVYASVACRFFDREYYEDDEPGLRWDHILRRGGSICEDTPDYHLIHEVYINVLRSHCQMQLQSQRPAAEARIKRVLGTIAMLMESVTIPTLTRLLLIPRTEDLERQLRPFGSLVNIQGPNHAEAVPLSFVHPSFREFIVRDEGRGGACPTEFFADPKLAHFELLKSCLTIMTEDLHPDMCQLKRPGTRVSDLVHSTIDKHLSGALQYACVYWIEHLERAGQQQRIESLADDRMVAKFLQKCLLFWLEALVLLRQKPVFVIGLERLKAMVGELATCPKLHDLLGEAKHLSIRFHPIIESAPLQIYCSALLFHPANSIIGTRFAKLMPDWIQPLSPAHETTFRPEESPIRHVLEFRSHRRQRVECMAFSQDGTMVAASNFHGLRVWDAASGATKLELDLSYGGLFSRRLALSRDGRYLAVSGCSNSKSNHIIFLYETATGSRRQLGPKDNQPFWAVTSLEFSGSGDREFLISYHRDHHLRVWEMNTFEIIRVVKIGSSDSSSSLRVYNLRTLIRLSPDGATLAVAGVGGVGAEGCILNIKTGDEIKMFMFPGREGHRQWPPGDTSILDLRLSEDGIGKLRVTAINQEGNIVTWTDSKGGSTCRPTLIWGVYTAAAFSPVHSDHVAIGFRDGSIALHDMMTGDPVSSLLVSHTRAIINLAFTQDGRQLASSSEDGTVRLWNMTLVNERLPETSVPAPRASLTAATFLPGSDCLVVAKVQRRDRNGLRYPCTTIWDTRKGIVGNAATAQSQGWKSQHSAYHLDISPDGELAMAYTYDVTLPDSDAQSNAQKWYGNRAGEKSYVLSSETADDSSRGSYILETRSMERVSPIFSNVLKTIFSSDGKVVVLLCAGTNGLRIDVLETYTWLSIFTQSTSMSKVLCYSLSQDGRQLAWAGVSWTGASYTIDNWAILEVQAWDITAGKSIARFNIREEDGYHLDHAVFSPDGALLLVPRDCAAEDGVNSEEDGVKSDRWLGSSDKPRVNEGWLFNVATGAQVSVVRPEAWRDGFGISKAFFSADSKYVAICSSRSSWNVCISAEGKQVLSLDKFGLRVSDLAFSASNGMVAVLPWQIHDNDNDNDTLQLLNASNGAQVGRINYHGVKLRRIRFSDEHKVDDRIDSDRGRLPLVQPFVNTDTNPPKHQFPQTRRQLSAQLSGYGDGCVPTELQDCLYVGSKWIYQGMQGKLIWLPVDFRELVVAVKGGRVFLSNKSGDDMMCFEIRLDATPWVKG